jgi:hypothetical protein
VPGCAECGEGTGDARKTGLVGADIEVERAVVDELCLRLLAVRGAMKWAFIYVQRRDLRRGAFWI